MKLLTKEIQKRMPELYSTENVPLDDKVVHVKYFSSWRWFATEACAICLDGDSDESVKLPLREFKTSINVLNTEYETENHGTVTVQDVLFFGWVQGFENEWGYFAMSELQSVTNPLYAIERDLYIDLPKPISEIGEYKRSARVV